MQAETFQSSVRTAVRARGLSLSRLSDHLARRGVRVSASTLSNWQRGGSFPRTAASRHALAALEEVLRVAPGSLLRLAEQQTDPDADGAPEGTAGDPNAAGRLLPLRGRMSSGVTEQLRARLSAPARGDWFPVSVQEVVELRSTSPTWRLRVRKVLRAERSGLDTHVVGFHLSEGAGAGSTGTRTGTALAPPAQLRAVSGCHVEQIVTDARTGQLAARLRFAPLAAGETLPLEFEFSGDAADSYHGFWFREAGTSYELTAHFDQTLGVRSAWHLRGSREGTPYRDVARLRLIGHTTAHLLVSDAGPGFQGLRWTNADAAFAVSPGEGEYQREYGGGPGLPERSRGHGHGPA